MLKRMYALTIGFLAFAGCANALEIPSINVSYVAVPSGIDILGVKTGMHVLDAEDVLKARGFVQDMNHTPGTKLPCSNRICITFQGYSEYIYQVRFTKGDDEVKIWISPPYADSRIMKVSRVVKYNGKTLPSFEKLFQDARPKFGRAVTWDSLERACWDYEGGSLLAKPELGRRKACSTLELNGVSDGFLEFERDPGERTVTYWMVDKLIERQIDKQVEAALSDEVGKAKVRQKQAADSASTPEL